MNKNFGTKANGGFSFLMKMLILVVCAAFSTSAFYAPNGTKAFADGNEELRGVWISTVANIDYPSRANHRLERSQKRFDKYFG